MVAYKVENNKVTCILVDQHLGRSRKYYGEAVCAPEDKFDIEKGKKIAFNRARLMELGENASHDDRLRKHLENVYHNLLKKLEKREHNRNAAKARAKEALKNAYSL